jgi:UDP-3-O-[3-hydroxymyristoyl] glucosamine N-acyltransferase
MQATAKQLAERIQATLEGPPDTLLTDGRSLGRAGPGHLSFIESARHLPELHESRADAVVAPLDLPLLPEAFAGRSVSVLRAADPLIAFLDLVAFLRGANRPYPEGIDPRAVVDPTVTLGPGCSVRTGVVIGAGTTLGARCVIHPGAVLGRNCKLGNDVIVFPNVTLYDDTVLGNRVIIHAGAVIGADGFGYRFHHGCHNKIPQLGWVEIGDDVEVGAGTTIDRGTVDPTIIGPGTKIDNQVQIGHNCEIGIHNLIVSQVGLGGSCVTGRYVTMAGQAGVIDHITIGDGAVLGAQAGVIRNVQAGHRVFGTPATTDAKRFLVCLPRLPHMVRDLNRIKQMLGLNEPEKQAG